MGCGLFCVNSKFHKSTNLIHYQENGTMLVLVLAAQCTPISMPKVCNYTLLPMATVGTPAIRTTVGTGMEPPLSGVSSLIQVQVAGYNLLHKKLSC